MAINVIDEWIITDLIFWHLYMKEKLEARIFHTRNTEAGVDKWTPLVITKKAWPIYQEEITYLFRICLDEGYHPKLFKTAILCALPKPGKRARALPRSYRLTALLSCLEKALEQIVAKRLGNIALKQWPTTFWCYCRTFGSWCSCNFNPWY